MNRIALIAAIALTGSLLATSTLAGGFGGAGIGQLPEPGKDKPDLVLIPIDKPKPKPAVFIPVDPKDDKPGIYVPPGGLGLGDNPVIPSDPIIPGAGNGSGANPVAAVPKLAPAQTRSLKLGCVVAGTPLATPNDIWLTNLTKGVLPAGLKIRFTVEGDGQTGILVLPQPIAPGQQLLLADIIDATAAGADCTAKAIA
jgi:hypothetical protein